MQRKRRGGGGGGGNPQSNYNPYDYNTYNAKDKASHLAQISPGSYVSQLDSAYGQKSTYVPKAKDIAHQNAVKAKKLTSNYRPRTSLYGGL